MNILESNTTKLDKHTINTIIKDINSMFGIELSEFDIRDIQLMQSKVIRTEGIDKNITARFAGLLTLKYNYKKVDLYNTIDKLSYITDKSELNNELKRIATIKEKSRANFKSNIKLLKTKLNILQIFT